MIHVGQPDLSGNERQYINRCLDENRLTRGVYVEQFERQLAEYIGTRHAIAVCNGTAALHLALLALGIGPGDEVIIPAVTFVATANAVTYCGARPVFVDIDPLTWNIHPLAAAQAVNRRTRAIIPVHLYGLPADMDSLWALATAHGLHIVEDACEALGAEWQGQKAGSIGHIGCFSFYGNKTITTGEGGALTTDDDYLAERIRLLQGQGQAPERRYWHGLIGYNYRMTELEGALGCAQMERLPEFLARRREIAERYAEWLPGLVQQWTPLDCTHSNWGVCVLLPEDANRDGLITWMEAQGVETRPMFYPLPALPAYRNGSIPPVAGQIARRGICLPCHPGLSNDDVRRVCETLLEVVKRG